MGLRAGKGAAAPAAASAYSRGADLWKLRVVIVVVVVLAAAAAAVVLVSARTPDDMVDAIVGFGSFFLGRGVVYGVKGRLRAVILGGGEGRERKDESGWSRNNYHSLCLERESLDVTPGFGCRTNWGY